MSRVGVKPVTIPSGVKVDVSGRTFRVEGPKGKLSLETHPTVDVSVANGVVMVARTGNDRIPRAMHGLTRALVQNMIDGCAKGFEKKLEIVGVGFGAQLAGKKIKLTVGYAKPVELDVPEGVTVTTPDATHVVVAGPDKQKVGQFAAEIRSVREPEPYKGTGIKYEGEKIRRKAGKAFGSAG